MLRLLAGLVLLAPALAAAQDIGRIASPGRLSRAHGKLEGLKGCQRCHHATQRATADLCLKCHPAIAERRAARKGVHRNPALECSRCHREHQGEDADLRVLDAATFDHAAETGFPLEGAHAKVGAECARCHKTRSFLTVKPTCGGCHEDAHQGQLGPDCARCHAATVPFKETRRSFDHARTRFPLTGAHAPLRCELCHKEKRFAGLPFASCTPCHKDPHSRPLGVCADCHTTSGFRTKRFDHTKTAFPLAGRHAALACTACHVQPAPVDRLRFDRCGACHEDAHRGVFPEDCAACHKVTGFAGATIDHAARAGFPLVEKHAPVRCAKCHPGAAETKVATPRRVVDFRGARRVCGSCHPDVHAGRHGDACESCHTPRTFKVTSFTHPRVPEFFTGRHAALPCERCHAPTAGDGRGGAVRVFKGRPVDCVSCHTDVHLGQVGRDCTRCHTVASGSFQAFRFDHGTTRLPLTGRHATAPCGACHRCETGRFPDGPGTAVRLTGVARDCVACHPDRHAGKLGPRCETCHDTETFSVVKAVR